MTSGERTSAVTADYLEALYNLEMEGETTTHVALAGKFGVSKAAVGETMRRLERDGLVELGTRGRAELTIAGRAQAEAALRRHRLAERWVTESLGLDWMQAHLVAHDLEHGMTPALEAHIIAALKNPKTCPHGNPIPGVVNAQTFLRDQQALRLSEAEIGATLIVVCLSELVEDEGELLREAGQVGLRPSVMVTVQERSQDGDLQLATDTGDVVAPGALARRVWMRPAANLVSAPDEEASNGTMASIGMGGRTS